MAKRVPPQDYGIVVVGGVRLKPPRSARDCTCVFCGRVRGRLDWVRGVVLALVSAVLVRIAQMANTHFHRVPTEGAGPIVAVILLAATCCAVLALAAFWTPAKRAIHRLHPKTRTWPPPMH